MRAGAAHHADVRLDHPVGQPAAVVDALVDLDVALVALLQPLLVAVEAVGVLHQELARAQDAALGPRLVPLLGLDVVPDLGQVAVAAQLARGMEGDHLLVREGEHVRLA